MYYICSEQPDIKSETNSPFSNRLGPPLNISEPALTKKIGSEDDQFGSVCRILHKFRQSLERFSIECRKTKSKPITYQLDYSANLKP